MQHNIQITKYTQDKCTKHTEYTEPQNIQNIQNIQIKETTYKKIQQNINNTKYNRIYTRKTT